MAGPQPPEPPRGGVGLSRRERRLRRALIGVAMLAGLLAVAIGAVIGYWRLYLLGPSGDPFTRGPYLVRVGLEDAELRWRVRDGRDVEVAALDERGDSVPVFDGRITGLVPGARYTWTASVGGRARAAGSFVTPSRDPRRTVRIAFLADHGDGSDDQWAVARTIAAWRPDLVVTGGDNSYLSAPDILLDRNIFRPFGEVMRHAPVYVGIGDHDMLPPGDEAIRAAFAIPGGGRYVVEHGRVQVVMLGNDSGGDAVRFARRTLAEPGFLRRFVVVHHPVTAGDPILPVLRRAGVDAVLSGNLHRYEQRVVEGVMTFTVGTGGVGPGRIEFTPESRDASVSLVDFGHLRIEVGPGRASYSFVDARGRVLSRISTP